MEAKVLQTLQYPTWIDSEKFARKLSGSVRFSRRMREEKTFQVLFSAHMRPNVASSRRSPDSLKVSCSLKNFPGS